MESLCFSSSSLNRIFAIQLNRVSDLANINCLICEHLKWKEYVWSVLACNQLQFTFSSSVFENQLASGSSSILSHTLSLLLMCRKVSDQLGEGMGCRDYRQTETKIEGASWVNLLWGVGHKWLQTIVVVSVCKELHCKPRQSAKRIAAVPGHGGKGSYSGSRRLSAGCSRAESWDFLLTRVCGRSPADVLLARQSVVFLPSHACAKRGRQQRREEEQEREQQRQAPHSWSVFSLLLRLINQLFQLTRNPKVSSVTLSTTGVLFFLSVPVLPTPERTWSSIPKRRICWSKCAPTG